MNFWRTNDFQAAVYSIIKPYDGKPFNLMISGGSLLDVLNYPEYRSLNSEKWRIFYADERCHQDYLNYTGSIPFISNLKAKVYPIRTGLGKENAAADYSKLFENIEDEASGPIIDVCLLGIGENGHICSLWPDTESLNSNERVIGVTVDCPFSPDRVTTTINFINNDVRDLYFIIPPKNGVPKKVTEPHPSINNKITRGYITILPDLSQY